MKTSCIGEMQPMSLLMLSYRGYASASLFHWTRPPSLRLSGKDKPVNMVRRGGGNKTKEYLRELKTVGLDSDPYDLPKNQWSTTDINIWTYINFGDFYRLCTNSGRMKEFLLTL